MRIALIGLATVGALVLGAETASAQYWTGSAAWCTTPRGSGDFWHCSYHTRAQCLASAHGLGLGCSPNPSAQWDRIEGRRGGRPSQQNWR
jgi:hypothetical protein